MLQILGQRHLVNEQKRTLTSRASAPRHALRIDARFSHAVSATLYVGASRCTHLAERSLPLCLKRLLSHPRLLGLSAAILSRQGRAFPQWKNRYPGIEGIHGECLLGRRVPL